MYCGSRVGAGVGYSHYNSMASSHGGARTKEPPQQLRRPVPPHHARPPLLPTPPTTTNTTPHKHHKTYKLNLKYIHNTPKANREEIFKITFGKLEAPLIRLSDTQNGYFAIAETENIIDRLLTPKAFTEFAKLNLIPILPPDIRARRTVFVRQVDYSVGSQTAENIKTEIETQNNITVNEIIKIKHYTHVFKIVFNTTTDAHNTLTHGLKAYHTRIAPTQCEQEHYTHIQICYKCYRFEHHTTRDCTKNTDICSECGEEGHTHQTCNNTEKRCINCSGPHRTLAASCPYRKQTIATKNSNQKSQQNITQNKTFADIAKHAAKETIQNNPPAPKITLTNKMHIKLTAIILEAHIASLTDTGNYGKILSESLKRNFDIDTKFPDRDSAKIFNLVINNPAPTIDEIYRLTPEVEDDPYMDDLDPRQSSLNLSDNIDPAPPLGPQFEQPRTPQRPKDPRLKTKTKTPTKQHNRQHRSRSTSVHRTQGSTPKRKASDDLPELERVWNEDDINRNTDYTPSQLGMRLYRSNKDLTKLPETLHPQKLLQLLSEEEFGLKLSSERGDIDLITNLIRSNRIKIKHNNIETLQHSDFSKLPRILILKQTKKPKSQQKTQ